VTRDGFTLCAQTWADSQVWEIQVGWVASATPALRVGTAELGSWPQHPIKDGHPATHTVDLPGEPPIVVAVALSMLDVDCGHNTRIKTQVNQSFDHVAPEGGRNEAP
jgi:hypothetical protein